MADTSTSAQKLPREKISKWDSAESPTAPLSEKQQDVVLELSDVLSSRPIPTNLLDEEADTLSSKLTIHGLSAESNQSTSFLSELKELPVGNAQQFYNWFCNIEEDMERDEETHYHDYITQLEQNRGHCDELLSDVNDALSHLESLKKNHDFVSTKTNALHESCEHLLEEQTNLMNVAESIQSKLSYFNELDRIQSKLGASSLTVTSESFIPMLSRLDECIAYISSNPQYKDSAVFLSRFSQCLTKALGLIKTHVVNLLTTATQNVQPGKGTTQVADDAFTLFYGKFRTSAPRVKTLMEQIEQRSDKHPSYEQLLQDCHTCYIAQRELLVEASILSAVTDLTVKHKSDHCALMRSGCSLMIHICEDEYQLYHHFFTRPSQLLDDFLEKLCNHLYDAFRPLIIHINHMETLSELCSILKVEMMEEHVYNNPQPLRSFEKVCLQMLHDVQERLVYRTYIYINTDILNYNPGAGDLAYPDKLEMMQSIAESLKHKEQGLVHSSSSQSLESQEVASITGLTNSETMTNGATASRISTGSTVPMSPADLHGMWYPTVRKTLVCLSKLSRCIDSTTFQGLSQEALSICIKSLQTARDKIVAKKTNLDGLLFYIKHLLIVREQITPFQANFAVKETQIGFSHIKDAAYGLMRRKSDLFKLNSNNAILQFLLDEVDQQLKKTCSEFIDLVTSLLLSRLQDFLQKVAVIQKAKSDKDSNPSQLHNQPFAKPEALRDLLAETYRNLKAKAPSTQKSMSLYLANRDTESILFKPIKLKIQKDLQSVIDLVSSEYTEEERLIIACPSMEQVLLVISPKS